MSKRGPPAHTALTPRQVAIMSAYCGTPNRSLGSTGAEFGISREAVRQVLAKHERLSGTPKVRNRIPRRPLAPRIAWRCVDCGEERSYTLAVARQRGTRPRCRACHLNQQRRHTDAEIEGWIARFRAGEGLHCIGRSLGLTNNRAATIVGLTIFSYLRRNGREAEVPAIWGTRSTHWLRRYGYKKGI